MEEKTEAIVVFTADYRDDDKMLTLFSPERGLVSAMCRGVKRASSKMKFAAQPFCLCDFQFNRKGDRLSVKGADLVEGFYPLREDIKKLYAGYVALEFVRKFVGEDMESGDLFALLTGFLGAVSYFGVSPKLALAGFLLKGLGVSGYSIETGGCRKCGKMPSGRAFFDFAAGAPVCETCRLGSETEVNPMTLALLDYVGSNDFCDYTRNFPDMIENKAVKLLTYYADLKAGVYLKTAADLIKL